MNGQLDYAALRKKAEEEAAIQATLMYPPGHKQDAERKLLADRMYLRYVTPLNVRANVVIQGPPAGGPAGMES